MKLMCSFSGPMSQTPADPSQRGQNEGAAPQVPQGALSAHDVREIFREMMREHKGAPTQGSETAHTPPIQGHDMREVTSASTAAPVRTQLHPIFNLPSMHQPQKFDGARDPIAAEEWLESVESVMALFDMTDQERVRYATYLFKSGVRIW